MKDSRKSTNSLLSNNSSLKKSGKLTSSLQALQEKSKDKPLPDILKSTLKKAREILIGKNIITDSLIDLEKFPKYDPTDPLKCTPRELTLKLIKQHEFLVHRVVALSETFRKQTLTKYGEGTEMIKDISAEETLSRQDVSIRSLKRENSFIKKQLECVRLQFAEKDEEVEHQASFIDLAKEQMQIQTASTSTMREENSKL